MKILHTSDWHVGKVLKGQPRLDEQIKVLLELIEVARAERPDLVLVAGDLFDTVAPTPEATKVVTRALSALRGTGAEVVAIAGNHDNGAALDALRPWADAAGIQLRGRLNTAEDHLITGTTGDGERWVLVALPFVSQRHAVRAIEMFSLTAAEATQTYADHISRLIAVLSRGFGQDTVNLVTAHLTVAGATLGGGERDAHTITAYAVPTTIFDPGTHYVALGHLHRRQHVPAGCPVHYSGSPLVVDFGEQENVPSVTLVEVTASTTAKTRNVPITAAARLRTVRGTLAELSTVDDQESWLRVIIREQPRAGLREAVQEMLPRALEVRIDPEMIPGSGSAPRAAARAGRAPGELFADYLLARGHADPDVAALFANLYDEVSSG